MNEKVKQVLKDIQIFFKQAEIDKRYDKQLTDHFLNCHNIVENALKQAEENEKELIAEQHRLFDLAKEQENELNELKEFVKLVIGEFVDVDCAKDCDTYDEYVSCYGRELTEAHFNLVKKVVEKYGKN